MIIKHARGRLVWHVTGFRNKNYWLDLAASVEEPKDLRTRFADLAGAAVDTSEEVARLEEACGGALKTGEPLFYELGAARLDRNALAPEDAWLQYLNEMPT